MLGFWIGATIIDVIVLIFCPGAGAQLASSSPQLSNLLYLIGLIALVLLPVGLGLIYSSWRDHNRELQELRRLTEEHQRSERGDDYRGQNRQIGRSARTPRQLPRQPRQQSRRPEAGWTEVATPRFQPQQETRYLEDYLADPNRYNDYDYQPEELPEPYSDPYGGYYDYSAEPQQRRIAEPVRQWTQHIDNYTQALPSGYQPEPVRVQGVPEYLNPTGVVRKMGRGYTVAELQDDVWYWIEGKMFMNPDGSTIQEKK